MRISPRTSHLDDKRAATTSGAIGRRVLAIGRPLSSAFLYVSRALDGCRRLLWLPFTVNLSSLTRPQRWQMERCEQASMRRMWYGDKVFEAQRSNHLLDFRKWEGKLLFGSLCM